LAKQHSTSWSSAGKLFLKNNNKSVVLISQFGIITTSKRHANHRGNSMTLNPIQQALLDSSSDQAAMRKAIESGVFYAEVIEDISGDLNPSSFEFEDITGPSLLATYDEALEEFESNQEEFDLQIAMGDRDENDEWEGLLVKVFWDGGDTITFADPHTSDVIKTANWKETCGL
jgi:hypothetical protein